METAPTPEPVNTETQTAMPLPGTALQWIRFPGIAWRTGEAGTDCTPQRRRADPPRASRFADLDPVPTSGPGPTA